MSDIDCRIEGRAGRITLTRPQALNALTYDMCLAIEAALLDWRDNPAVAHVVIDAEGERAFCAGGDITRLYAAGIAGDDDYPRRFWQDEYRMNAVIESYPKPYIAIMHGFVMGGGVGISAHGSHRIVTDSTRLAMPECGIGLVPDVGGSLLLARAPGRLGDCLGLTGHRMQAADAIHAGFADHYVAEPDLAGLVEALCDADDIDAVIAGRAGDPGPSLLARHADAIDRVFGAADVPMIAAALADDSVLNEAFARMASGLAAGSPTALVATHALIAAVRKTPTMETALDFEYRFTSRAMRDTDFIEGIRAAVIDKDHKPQWRFADAGAVPPDLIASLLAPLD